MPTVFCLDSGWKVHPVPLVATMQGLCCVPFQCYRGWGRGEGTLFLCDAADVTEEIPAFVLNKPNTGFMCTQGFFIYWGSACAKVGGCCNETTEIPYFVPFFTGTFSKWKAFSWEGVRPQPAGRDSCFRGLAFVSWGEQNDPSAHHTVGVFAFIRRKTEKCAYPRL